jgi:hypothetical protein
LENIESLFEGQQLFRGRMLGTTQVQINQISPGKESKKIDDAIFYQDFA